MYALSHWFLLILYFALPPIALIAKIRKACQTRSRRPVLGFMVTMTSALLLGGGVCVLYAVAADAEVRPAQVARATYFALSLLLILKMIDRILIGIARRLGGPQEWSQVLANLCRIGLMVALVLPVVMAAVMVYRPKVGLRETPVGYYERVEFQAADGTRLVGWWIPAGKPTDPQREHFGDEWGADTVIACHGLGANKANQLLMTRWCRPMGYNALIFDFRAHGESGGQLTTFGINETEDVLAALQWVKQNHPEASRKVFGIGTSLGAAALISAAADPRGSGIDAVAAYGTYASLGTLADDVTRNQFPRPIGWLIRHIGLPVASMHTGVDLSAFAPEKKIAHIWPRPVLIIHAMNDEVIPFRQGERLYDAASEPRRHIWTEIGGHNQTLNDDGIAQSVMQFFREAYAIPAI